jgi:hypothetical protein
LPPLSHLGATLLRHSVHTALRYALYQLGQHAPKSPPVRFVSLRLYLDAPALRESLGSVTDSEEILGALLDPGGIAFVPLSRRLRGTLWFHRRRLGAKTSGVGRWLWSSPGITARDRKPGAQLSDLLPGLGDALLGELVAVLDRRRSRAAGKRAAAVQSFEAARFLEGDKADLSRLGLPDPIAASWGGSKPPVAPGTSVPEDLRCPHHRFRGGFRERYRQILDRLRPSLLELAERAVAKGYLASAEDLFFLPFDLIDDLDADTKPRWLDGAIESNRAEWRELRGRKAPADTLGNVAPAARLDLPEDLVPLWPLT